MMPMLKFWQSYNTKNVRKESFRKMNQNEPIFQNLYIRDTENRKNILSINDLEDCVRKEC